jgi:hypothetical protein
MIGVSLIHITFFFFLFSFHSNSNPLPPPPPPPLPPSKLPISVEGKKANYRQESKLQANINDEASKDLFFK